MASLPRFRLRPLEDPVTVTLDGEEIVAERGEPVAAALVAAGKFTIARSPKFHRPRGPACMRGACDGCLARVDETPNVMTCMIPAADGTAVVTQNRLGPRDADVLRVTDWFFPDGMNHHELFAGVPGIQSIMQGFARRIAGLGKLPLEKATPRPAVRRTADVVVVGAGPSGMAVASRLARAGRVVELIDDRLTLGGSVLALGEADRAAFEVLRAEVDALTRAGQIRIASRTTAAGAYGKDLLVVGEAGAEIVAPEALVFACGAHDGILAFEGNDVPGVMSARAAGMLLGRGVLVGERVAIVVVAGGGPFGASYARALPSSRADVKLVHGEPLVVHGQRRIKSVRVRLDSGKEVTLEADALLVDAPRAPAYELCQQAGASLAHEPRGFVVRAPCGLVADGVWVAGEAAGVAFDARALFADADAVARAIA